MKGEFNVYDVMSSGARDSATPSMHFSKSGVISVNAGAVKLLDLHPGDTIKFYQMKSDPKEWFFAKTIGGFKVRKAYDKASKGLMLNSAFTCKSIMRALNMNKGFKVQIGSEPDDDGWWSLITARVK